MRPEGLFLTDLDDILCNVFSTWNINDVPGWRTRSRNGEGFDGNRLEGISIHSTDEGITADGWPSAYHQTFISDIRPNHNIYIDRKGTWWLLAAGPTNACGKGGPWHYVLPKDGANRRTLSIAVANDGDGETYSLQQQQSIMQGMPALWDHYSNLYDWGLEIWRIFGHHEWAPSTKSDPCGSSAWTSTSRLRQWDMDLFRADIIKQSIQVSRAIPSKLKDNALLVNKGIYIYTNMKESAWEIAQKVYGIGEKYPEILQENPGNWRIGDRLKIPGIKGYLVEYGTGNITNIIKNVWMKSNAQILADYYLYNGGTKFVFTEKDKVFIKTQLE